MYYCISTVIQLIVFIVGLEPVEKTIHQLIQQAEHVIATEKSFVEPNMGFAYQYAYLLLKKYIETQGKHEQTTECRTEEHHS